MSEIHHAGEGKDVKANGRTRHPGAKYLQEILELRGKKEHQYWSSGAKATQQKLTRASLVGAEALEERHSLHLRYSVRQRVWERNTLASLFLQPSIFPPGLSKA